MKMMLAAVALLACGAWGWPSQGQSRRAASSGRCPFFDEGTIPGLMKVLPTKGSKPPTLDNGADYAAAKKTYYEKLKSLDIKALYDELAQFMVQSQGCWPADGPQDGDGASYAGLMGRLAWHCAGTFRLVKDKDGKEMAYGGCEGGRMRFFPENEWRDNTNLDKARALLVPIYQKFKGAVSWGDLIAFAGAVGIKVAGGPMKKFCFGRVDDDSGYRSLQLGKQGVNQCKNVTEWNVTCESEFPCKSFYRHEDQVTSDHFMCNLTQPSGRMQASHSVGLIYVYPMGPSLKNTSANYKIGAIHNRCPKLSALDVRDTFKNRMGWTDRETVALIGGGHTLGRMHGSCKVTDENKAWGEGPFYEVDKDSGRGPTDGSCGGLNSMDAGKGNHTVTSGFDGAWTTKPSTWTYDYFNGLFDAEWEPCQSAAGNDQWCTRNEKYAKTYRLTADLALINDPIFSKISQEYKNDTAKFNSDFADAWFKLVHRSAAHPKQDDLEKDANKCITWQETAGAFSVLQAGMALALSALALAW